ncbi:hypothetical protein ABT288_23160 [Streptomyces sp. NPDC001093]|uniref:hypothetical protein n=1 Tax=Streptomyces sp. NPDC001093 TaxID=3154376 RepID=UPI00332CBB2C
MEMTMKRLLARVQVAVAAAAIAGGALLGSAGTAIAAPVAHGQVADAMPEKAGGLVSFPGRHGRGHEGERDDGPDGRRLYVRHEGRWTGGTPVRESVGVDRWYVDQLREAVGVDRWYVDQLREAVDVDRWYADQLVLVRPSAYGAL